MKNKYEEVISILNEEDYGCINTGNIEEFNQISNKIIGYGCFKKFMYMALIQQLRTSFKSMREQGILNNDYIFDFFCEDEDYRFPFQVAQILFPEVLALCNYDKEGVYTEIDSVHAFHVISKYDIENICDMFAEEVRDNVKASLKRLHTTDEATEAIIQGAFILPF